MAKIITRRQSVNFLGFLRSQLSGLQGIPTLCYELIQNADDVKDDDGRPGASRITFDVCDDALYVENDGVFRDIDFNRMENVSWGNKREEAGTTGAFGIGFISVYQITDSPEIFSSGRHWKFQPDAPENDRIQEQLVPTKNTQFRLPWAFEVTNVRKELRIPSIEKKEIDDYAEQINLAIEAAALFLKQVTVLEVKRNGKLVRHIEVLKEGHSLLIADGDRTTQWRIIEGSFDEYANDMRCRYGPLIEDKRQSVVKIAIPDDLHINGRLYAFLPSETNTGFPFHINADFYPSQDRKRIPFEQSYQSEWNYYAIQCAAETLARNVEQLLDIFSQKDFWEFLEIIKKGSETNTLSPVFSKFWEEIKPQVRFRNTVETASGKRVKPAETIYLDSDEQIQAGLIFEELRINTVHPDLRGKRNLLVETGVRLAKISDIIEGLRISGLTQRMEMKDCPKGLQTDEGWQLFWTALNNLWDRSSSFDKQKDETPLKSCSIAFSSDGALWPIDELSKGEKSTQTLFSRITSVKWFDEKPGSWPLPGMFIKKFGLVDGVTSLSKAQSTFIGLWEKKIYNPEEVYEWLESYRNEILLNYSVRQEIRSLAIWPSADKTLKPLTEMYLAGDFQDPLQLTQIIDIETLGNRREFLESVLEVEKLDFITYVRDWIPSVVSSEDLNLNNRFKLLEVLSENLGKLQGHIDLQRILSTLPLVWCGQEKFMPAMKVYFDSKIVKEVLGPNTPMAQLPGEHKEAIRAFYEWLGVSFNPRSNDVIYRIRYLVAAPPTITSIQAIEIIFRYIANQWSFWTEETRRNFYPLTNLDWLPGTKNPNEWFRPDEIYASYRSFLFESQANFLKLDRHSQDRGSDLIKYLGIRSEPDTEQVVKHLLYSCQKNLPITQEIYVFLNHNASDPSIRSLRGKACLYLRTKTGEEKYFRPDQVFWEEHPFWNYRYRLTPEFGRFKNLFDQLYVKQKPDARDAISVLLEIAIEFGSSNVSLNNHNQEEDVVIRCWRLISSALENGEIDPTIIKNELGNKKTIPDSRYILEPPKNLFFEDRPDWGSKFNLVQNSLTPRIEGAWLAMEAAGVRRLSRAVETELHDCVNRRESTVMRKELLERRTLIQRIIEAHRMKGIKDFDIEKLEAINFYEASKIVIVRVFNGFGRQERSKLETVDAVLLNQDLFYYKENGLEPWKGISRELSYVLHPSGELSSLGMELKEIFSQSITKATAALDDYGYPRIEMGFTEIPDSPSLEPSDHNGEIEPLSSANENADENGGEPKDDKGGHPGHDKNEGGKGPGAERRENVKPEKRKTSRLVSYVYPKDAISTSEEDFEVTEHRTLIGQLGVSRVMEYERNQGRSPIDMETIQVHHPGYDIKSTDSLGVVRYIEVKSFSGIWDSQNPARLTKTEYEAAREFGDSYYLYVVEKVEDEDFKIWRLRSPGLKANYYLLDHQWLGECEE